MDIWYYYESSPWRSESGKSLLRVESYATQPPSSKRRGACRFDVLLKCSALWPLLLYHERNMDINETWQNI